MQLEWKVCLQLGIALTDSPTSSRSKQMLHFSGTESKVNDVSLSSSGSVKEEEFTRVLSRRSRNELLFLLRSVV
jgi:hypothetical protein